VIYRRERERRKMEKITITKEKLKDALLSLAKQERFFRPGQYMLCRQVYKGIGEGVTYDCSTYFEEGIDELFKELKK
jgi:hypothetical protein